MSISIMSGVKKPKLTSNIRSGRKPEIGERMQTDSHERSRNKELDNRKLRESVLNKLWDSLPPETQILPHPNDEDSDSTQSGLDEGEFEGIESVEKSKKIVSSKDVRSSLEFTIEEVEDMAGVDIPSTQSSQTKSCLRKTEDSVISWEMNLDFIQSIIWLKSKTAKLQRVSVDEFLKVFKNQWELSQEITSAEILVDNPGRLSSSTETKQREKLDLIKNRLANNNDNSKRGNKWDTVIPESDESVNASLQSSQSAPDRAITITNTRVSESMGISTVDSGFNSEKPESGNSDQCVIENANKKQKTENFESTNVQIPREYFGTLNSLLGAKERAKLIGTIGQGLIHGEGCSSGQNPLGKIHRTQNENVRILKRKRDATFGSVSKTTTPKRTRLSISSATLNYVLRSSECNKVLVTSVQVILEALENGVKGFHGPENNWYDLVQKEAIDAVVSIVDLLEKEKGPISCRKEVVAMVKRVLEKMLDSNDVDKLTAWEHHRLMVLELCNASSVCTEVVNYLISELEELIPVAMQTTEETMRASLVVMDKSYILFHSLKVAIKKYRSFTPTSVIADQENTSQEIPEVTDLWKRHWKATETEPDIFVSGLKMLEIPDDPEELWAKVLEELVVVSTRIWPLVKILAWQCLAVLKSPISSETRT